MKKKYKGVVEKEIYGYRNGFGYDSSVTLECDDGESIPLGNGNYDSIFSKLIGKRIELTIKELKPAKED